MPGRESWGNWAVRVGSVSSPATREGRNIQNSTHSHLPRKAACSFFRRLPVASAWSRCRVAMGSLSLRLSFWQPVA